MGIFGSNYWHHFDFATFFLFLDAAGFLDFDGERLGLPCFFFPSNLFPFSETLGHLVCLESDSDVLVCLALGDLLVLWLFFSVKI